MEPENISILQKASHVISCDVSQTPSSPCLPLCTNQDQEEGHHDNRKLEQQEKPVKKVKPKGKLVRSMAVCEESSPFENCTKDSQTPIPSSNHDNESTSCNNEALEKSQNLNKDSLSKESSLEYKDSTGIDLKQFITHTLNSNPRDRMSLLKLEQDMIDYITSNSPFKKFPQMSSYHRMLVHRVAAYFGMEHNVDQTGKAVIINRTSSTRIPEQRFMQQIQEKTDEIQQWKAILKRDNSSDEQPLSLQENGHMESRVQEEYNLYAETQRKRQLYRGSRGGSSSSWTGSSQQSSTETDCRCANGPPPWSSTDSDSSCHWTSPAPKPDARGTGTISLYRVSSTCPNPSSPPDPTESAPAVNSTYGMENAIPPGSILVNPQTGQPFLNPDGTPVVYNPPDSQQPIRSQPHLPATPLQQQQPQVVQYPSVQYPALPSQAYPTIEDLSSQFSHVTVGCQSTGEAPPLYQHSQSYVYAAPPPPPSNQVPGYCQSSSQVPVYYYSGQYPTSAPQTCRPLSPSQHLHSQTGYSMALGFQSSQSQTQSILGNYPSISAHRCGLGQAGGSVSYLQNSVVAPLGGDGGYCCMGPPPCTTVAPPSHPGTYHAPSCINLGAQAWGVQY